MGLDRLGVRVAYVVERVAHVARRVAYVVGGVAHVAARVAYVAARVAYVAVHVAYGVVLVVGSGKRVHLSQKQRVLKGKAGYSLENRQKYYAAWRISFQALRSTSGKLGRYIFKCTFVPRTVKKTFRVPFQSISLFHLDCMRIVGSCLWMLLLRVGGVL